MRIALILSVFLGFFTGIAMAQGAPPAPVFVDYSKTWTDATIATIVTDLRSDLSVPIALIGDWSKEFDIVLTGLNQSEPDSIVEFVANQAEPQG